MGNRKSIPVIVAGLALGLALGLACGAQVLSVASIKDPQSQALQQRYNTKLRDIGAAAAALRFPYPFYFSDTLDIDEAKQKLLPQGSLHFGRFQEQLVLQITGNYYVCYAAAMMGPNQRAHKTFDDAILPLLTAEVEHTDRTIPFDAYAFEIAYHVRAKVLKVDTEGPENLVVVVPRGVAERLVKGPDIDTRQGALLESEVFLNGQPLTLWLSGDEAPADVKNHYLARREHKEIAEDDKPAPESGTLVDPHLIPQSELLESVRAHARTEHDVSPAKLMKLEMQYEDTTQKLVNDLNAQAHFVAYAPPAFIAFRDGAYLQLNLSTDLDRPSSSQYRIAALAFDTHISHLLRPVSKYFHDNPQFEGIDFSTTVHQAGQANNESVEFVTPLAALVCYERYDCTGQELINRSIVLINGERVELDLQKAESDTAATAR